MTETTQENDPIAETEILELTDLQHARIRTEMYFGSRTPESVRVVGYEGGSLCIQEFVMVPALDTMFREIRDNALDEVVGFKAGSRIDFTFDPETLEFTVEDDGRGVPLEHVQTVFTKARAGRNFRSRKQVAGTNGLGASIVNFCSRFFEVTVHRDGKKYFQRFRQDPLDPSELVCETPIIEECSKRKHGTKVRFIPDPEVFPQMIMPEAYMKSRIHEIAAINHHVRIHYNGELVRVRNDISESLFKGMKPIRIDLNDQELGFNSQFFLVPKFTSSSDDTIHSVVNNICAYNGGTHIKAFQSVFYNGMIEALKSESRKRKLPLVKSDIANGLLIYNVTRMEGPNFDSQSKNRLTNKEADTIVRKQFDETVFRKIIRQNPDWVDHIFSVCAERTQKKDQKAADEASKKANKVKVAKLTGANGKDRSKCILIIGEGDSACAGVCQVRDPKIHGTLPLRGKTMNVTGTPMSKIVAHQPYLDIMGALGLKIGTRVSETREELMYGRVWIATDEDEDGKNIMCLLTNFFYTFWPELFDPTKEPFFYKFETPFIKCKHKKTGEIRYFYGRNEMEFDPEEYSKGWSITRAKGLGNLMDEDWINALSNPSVIPIMDSKDTLDGGKMKEMEYVLDLVFNETKADDRKDWLGL